MKTIELALAAAILCTGCSQGSPAVSAPASTETANATETPALSPSQVADDVLQARLRKAAAEYEGSQSVRDPEQYGAIGLLGSESRGPRLGGLNLSGRRPPEAVQRIVKQNFGRFRLCYEAGLLKDPALKGKVVTEFVILPTGKVKDVKSSGDLPNEAVKTCVQKAFASLSFEKGEAETKVTYPINFASEGGEAPPATSAKPSSDPLATSKPAAPPASASAAPPRRLPPPDGPWPIVVVEGTKVTIGGQVVADTTAVAGEGRVKKVDGVFNAMKAWRDDWKSKNPDYDFIGLAGLRVDPNANALVVKSVFQSIAYAGFPDILVQSATEPTSIHALAAQVPGPPDPAPLAERREPPRWLAVHLDKGETSLVWKQAAVVVEEHKLAPADLASKVCETWKKQGEHRDASDPRADSALIFLDNALSYAELTAAVKAVESCKRPGPGGADRSAFWITFTVR
ncbi:MAG: AgmX/PglI C-terminal domain-containing protein [Polyangiaceae bacterium]|nr:AgmX/PglI C-terminal domain-containing protein [Polyangiaceae bacterium]